MRGLFIFITILIFNFINISLSEKVYIKFNRPSVTVGDSLKITCTITDVSPTTTLANFFKCPYGDSIDFCLKNCDNFCQTTHQDCNTNELLYLKYQCYRKLTGNTLTYTYTISRITETIINNKSKLFYGCRYKDIKTEGFIEVERPSIIVTETPKAITKAIPKGNPNLSTTTQKSLSETTSTTNDYILKINNIKLRLRDVILISLSVALIISFIINILCGIRICCDHCRKNQRYAVPNRTEPHYSSSHQNDIISYRESPHHSVMPNQYIDHRSGSQPILNSKRPQKQQLHYSHNDILSHNNSNNRSKNNSLAQRQPMSRNQIPMNDSQFQNFTPDYQHNPQHYSNNQLNRSVNSSMHQFYDHQSTGPINDMRQPLYQNNNFCHPQNIPLSDFNFDTNSIPPTPHDMDQNSGIIASNNHS